MNKKISLVAGIALCALILLLTVFYAASLSADRIMPCDIADSYAKEAIEAVLEAGLMDTYTVDERVYFEPQSAVTRAALAKALVLYLGLDATRWQNDEVGFADESTTYAPDLPYIRAALANGLMPLCGDYRFDAERTVSREEAAAIFGALCKAEISAGREEAFSDFREVGEYYLPGTKKTVDFEIMIGYTDGTFRPKGTLSREELALVLYRLTLTDQFGKE